MAGGRLNPVVVRETYDDEFYREFLWNAFTVEYRKGSVRRRRSPFVEKEFWPLLEEHAGRIHIDNGEKYEFDVSVLYADYKRITQYVNNPPQRIKAPEFLRCIDAFLQLRIPGFNSDFMPYRNTDAVGLALGEFLRDPRLAKMRSSLDERAKSLLGIYKYREVDTLQRHHGVERCVAFVAGKNADYVLMLDFLCDAAKAKNVILHGRHPEKAVDLFQGFCIPGQDFSPVFMRSAYDRERLSGLLYAPRALVDLSDPAFNELTLEVFTTRKEHQGSRHDKTSDPALAKALEIYHGPRLRRFLKRVDGKREVKALNNVVD